MGVNGSSLLGRKSRQIGARVKELHAAGVEWIGYDKISLMAGTGINQARGLKS